MGILDRIIGLMLEKPGEEKESRQGGSEFPSDAAIGCAVVFAIVTVVAAFLVIEYLRFISTK